MNTSENTVTEMVCVCACFQTGVRFPEESTEDVQKQKQLLKDAAAFLVSGQVPSLVSDTHTPTELGLSRMDSVVKIIYI